MNKRIESIVRDVIQLMAKSQWDSMKKFICKNGPTCDELQAVIQNYGCTLIAVPDTESAAISIIEIKDSSPRSWSVVAPLWTVEENRSDLSLEATVVMRQDNSFSVCIDNIHVL